jgi:uncharacterized protein (TIGR03663 family)
MSHEASRPAEPPIAEERTPSLRPDGVLDRRAVHGGVSWWTIWSAVALAGAVLFRLIGLDRYALTPMEGRFAFQGWAVLHGEGAYGPGGLPDIHPLVQLAVAFSLFLSGASDVTARLAPVAAGIGIVLLIFLLRPVARPASVLGLLLAVGLSPSLIYFSRTIDPAIFFGFFTMLLIVAVVRSSTSISDGRLAGWSAVAGIAIAGLIASGPAGISVLLAAVIAAVVSMVTAGSQRNPDGLGVGARRIATTPIAVAALSAGLVIALALLFTRLLSDIGAVSGIPETFSEWARLIGTRPTTTPTQFFLWSTLLYELVAVVLTVVALLVPPMHQARADGVTLRGSTFAIWFGAALVLQSMSSGREPEQFVLISLPLVIAAGIGLGRIIERIEAYRLLSSIASLVPLSALAILIGVIAILIAVARSNDPGTAGGQNAIMEIIIVLLLVIVPFSTVLARAMGDPRGSSIVAWSATLVLVAVLGMFGVRNASMLAFERSDDGTELLAQETTTNGVVALVNQVTRLSRDLSVGEATLVDPTGRYGLAIALSPDSPDPYRWYFREFPEVSVSRPAGWGDADVVIAPSSTSMAEQGYIVQTRAQFNRVPPAYQGPDTGEILSHIVTPGKWYEGIRFLLFRDSVAVPQAEPMAIGYTAELGNQINPALGPFNLADAPGRGSALGQLDSPIGVAPSPNGDIIYVVNSNNLRIERYSGEGEFIGVWGGEADPNLTFASAFGTGPTGIAVSPDGLIYVADTWNHRVVAIDRNGQFVREIGQRGGQANLNDDPDPTGSPGLFFGPRGIAIHDGEIFVTDTGNERVQVFASDGTFLRAFGGFGDEPGKLIEPVGIVIDDDGTVYVADSGNGRLSIFARDGSPLSQVPIATWQEQSQLVNYLALGPDGLIYMTSPSAGTLDVFDPDRGQVLLTTTGTESAPFEQPVGVAVMPDGELLVSDLMRHDIIRFMMDIPDEPVPATPVITVVATPAG